MNATGAVVDCPRPFTGICIPSAAAANAASVVTRSTSLFTIEIRRRVAAGEAPIDVACDYGLTTGMVWQIANRWHSRRTDR